MHIELTDHLRCPEAHEEGYLILLPETMAGRLVMAGVLACPACGWQTSWSNGVPEFGTPWESHAAETLPVDAVPAMLGIEGPGGWVALAGGAGVLAEALTVLLPGVAFVAINPPATVASSEAVSLLRGDAWPLKSHALRGVVVGADASQWSEMAAQSLLPGRQMIGAGTPPAATNLTVLATIGSLWVVRRG